LEFCYYRCSHPVDIHIDSVESSSDSSDTDSSSGLLEFPQEHYQGGINFTGADNDEDEIEETMETHFNLPASLTELQKKLLGGYTTPKECPDSVYAPRDLTPSEMLSFWHYIAWRKSNGTVLAYKLHAQVLQHANAVEILSLASVRKLAEILTELKPLQVDMCPKSCMAYTGDFADLEFCSYIHKGKTCGQPRYQHKTTPNAKNKPVAQMMCLPIVPGIRAMFANADTSNLLRHRDKCLQKALHLLATAAGAMKYSDFGDSRVHIHHQSLGLFKDSRDIALGISTDGAQLTMKKQSDTWLFIFLFLNLPPEFRYKSNYIFYPFSIPGPNPPGIVESFLWPVFEEMAMLNEGIWMWDAVDSSYFVNHAYICMALGDMLGSAKLNGMAGHSAVHGDRFSMVMAARASIQPKSKYQYYPISPPEAEKYNAGRPKYNLDKLPIRTESSYWNIINQLQNATSKAHSATITRETGVSHSPLCAASPAFVHPSFFPLDPFHLLYENCMAFLWDLWVTMSAASEIIHLGPDRASKFGKLVSEAMSTLPASFCGPVRDPFLKRQSQYKIYEWMALLHWYIIPIGIEVEFPPALLQKFSDFVEVVEMAMTISPRSEQDLIALHKLIQRFLKDFEKIYVGNDPTKVSRCRLCIFQLIHVPQHIEWNGSIRLGSQATVERAIGEIGHKIRSKKAPFANLANIIYEREMVKILCLYYPSLDLSLAPKPKDIYTPQSKIRISKMEQKGGEEFHSHVNAICQWLGIDFDAELKVHRWGKVRIPDGKLLRSRSNETRGKAPSRSARYFEAENSNGLMPVFGEALAFFELLDKNQLLVVYNPLNQCQQVLKKWRGVWSNTMKVLPVSKIQRIVGIWPAMTWIYILWKHPGLDWLSEEESAREPDDTDAEEEENEDNH
jgi:hypothetical protein